MATPPYKLLRYTKNTVNSNFTLVSGIEKESEIKKMKRLILASHVERNGGAGQVAIEDKRGKWVK